MNLWLVAGFLAVTASPVLGQDRIRVGAWNIETLGSPESRDYLKKSPSNGYGVPREPAELAERIEVLGLDVLALSEIDDTDARDGSVTNRVLDEAFRILNRRAGNDWDYRVVPQTDPPLPHATHGSGLEPAANSSRGQAVPGPCHRRDLAPVLRVGPASPRHEVHPGKRTNRLRRDSHTHEGGEE